MRGGCAPSRCALPPCGRRNTWIHTFAGMTEEGKIPLSPTYERGRVNGLLRGVYPERSVRARNDSGNGITSVPKGVACEEGR